MIVIDLWWMVESLTTTGLFSNYIYFYVVPKGVWIYYQPLNIFHHIDSVLLNTKRIIFMPTGPFHWWPDNWYPLQRIQKVKHRGKGTPLMDKTRNEARLSCVHEPRTDCTWPWLILRKTSDPGRNGRRWHLARLGYVNMPERLMIDLLEPFHFHCHIRHSRE